MNLVGIALLLGALLVTPQNVQSIGVCYGTQGDNLPAPRDAIRLIKSNSIFDGVRIYSPDGNILQALRGSGLTLLLTVPNGDLQSLARSYNSAVSWVRGHIQPYASNVNFKWLAVGNEVIPGSQSQYILPAMKNLRSAISAAGLTNRITVTTAVHSAVIGKSYPPSAGAFSNAALPYMRPIVDFLVSTNAPLLANIYPYFSYTGNKGQISLDYALFTSPGTVVQDGQYSYQNLFDALLDSMYAALEKVGGGGLRIVVSESGWPSAGGDSASVQNARTYNSNLVKHIQQGTPRRRGRIEAYIFALFNEDLKEPHGTENYFGLFYPNGQPVYKFYGVSTRFESYLKQVA